MGSWTGQRVAIKSVKGANEELMKEANILSFLIMQKNMFINNFFKIILEFETSKCGFDLWIMGKREISILYCYGIFTRRKFRRLYFKQEDVINICSFDCLVKNFTFFLF